MDAENKNNVFKILVGVLSLLLIVLAVYTIKLYNDSKDTAIILQEQKADIETKYKETWRRAIGKVAVVTLFTTGDMRAKKKKVSGGEH